MNLKELFVAVFTAVSGITNAYLWKQFIALGMFDNPLGYALPLAALLLFTVSFSFLAILVDRTALGVAAVLVAFIGSFILVKAVALVLSALLLSSVFALWGFRAVRQEVRRQTVISFHRILRSGLPAFFTSVALLISTFYFLQIGGVERQSLLPKSAFDVSLPYLERVFQGILPGFRSEASVDEMLEETVRKNLFDEAGLQQIPASEIEKLAIEERRALERWLGVKISGDERAGEMLYLLVNQKAEDFLGPYSSYIPYLSAFGFFLAIKVLTLPLYFVSLGLIWLLAEALLAIGALKMETVNIEAKRIRL